MGAELLFVGGLAAYMFWPRKKPIETDQSPTREKGEMPPYDLGPEPEPLISYDPFANTIETEGGLLSPFSNSVPPDLPGYSPPVEAGDFWFYKKIGYVAPAEPLPKPLAWVSQPGFLAAEAVAPVFELPPFLLEYVSFDWIDGAIWMFTPEGNKLGVYGGQAVRVVLNWQNNAAQEVSQNIKLWPFNTGWTPSEQELTLAPKAKGQTIHFLIMPISKLLYSVPLLVGQGQREAVQLTQVIWVSPAPAMSGVALRPEAVLLD